MSLPSESDFDALFQRVRARLGLGPLPWRPPFQPADSSPANLPRLIDHTLLKPEATADQVRRLCEEARHFGFAAVCINPIHVALAARLLQGTTVRVCTVVGFPLGATLPEIKVHETQLVIANGAHEVDMVINIGALKAGMLEAVRSDIAGVAQACHEHQALCKVIIETAYLTTEEKITACLVATLAGADFVKTSTGFGPSGATVEDVALMRRVITPTMGVKAAGGIRDLATARAMVQAGATRIGASASVRIMQEAGVM